jgi:methylmalonyl-CoA mutase
LRDETRLHQIADAAGGSWYVESLTYELARKAWGIFQTIESEGGLEAFIRAGNLQEAVLKAQAKRYDQVASRRAVFVGTNMYANTAEILAPDTRGPCPEEIQNIRQGMGERQKADVLNFESLLTAIETGASLGELVPQTLETPTLVTLAPRRATEQYEDLRQKITSKQEPVIVLNLLVGHLRDYKPRADFSRDFFEPAGVKVIDFGPIETFDQATLAQFTQTPTVVVLCSSDERYKTVVAPACSALQQTWPQALRILAGYPQEDIEEFKQLGIQNFVHLRASHLETLQTTFRQSGIFTEDKQ